MHSEKNAAHVRPWAALRQSIPPFIRFDIEQAAALLTYSSCPTECRHGLTACRVFAWVSRINSVSRQKQKSTFQLDHRWKSGLQQEKQPVEIVRSRNAGSGFFQKCLHVFFNQLLAVEANEIMNGIGAVLQLTCAGVVGFGFSDPFTSQAIHRSLSPS